MYNQGDVVVYASTGVCEIENVGSINIGGIPKDMKYYTLRPLSKSHKETIYVPTTTKAFMRPAISADRAMEYISKIEDIEPVTPDSNNPKVANDFYNSMLKSYDCDNVLTVLVSLVKKRRDVAQKGKFLNQTQQICLKQAEEMLYSEFSQALDTTVEQVRDMVEEKID